jgi:hypothetical protein
VAVEEWLDSLVHDYRKKEKATPLANGVAWATDIAFLLFEVLFQLD